MRHPDAPPLSDVCWNPFWLICEERYLAAVVLASLGWEQSVAFRQAEKTCETGTGLTDREMLVAHADAVSNESLAFRVHQSLHSRRPLLRIRNK